MQNKPEKCVYLHMTISRCPGSVVKGASGVAGTQTLVSGGGLGGLGGGLGGSSNNTVAGAVDQRGAQVSCDWWRAGHVTPVLTSDWSRCPAPFATRGTVTDGAGFRTAARATPASVPGIRGGRGGLLHVKNRMYYI